MRSARYIPFRLKWRATCGQGLPQLTYNSTLFNNAYISCRTTSFIRCQSDFVHREEAAIDGRARLSRLWVPTGGIAASSEEDSHAKLVRAGFIRQTHSGVFHLLPLGRRVQDKLEALIDRHMYGLGASKLALSSISSEELWSRSGRLGSVGSELFRFKDRKDVGYLLSPTHEEEITSLVSGAVKSYKELPVRLYQISRKYRDERRPRHGLLRSREFVMKDLYTFDYNPSLALATYHQVREAYARLFDELKIPYLVAEADSGDMGGNLSHEFHFPTSKGEDHVISCIKCDYVANEELAESRAPNREATSVENSDMSTDGLQVWRGISRDRLTLINVWYLAGRSKPAASSDEASQTQVNIRAIKTVIPEFDASIDNALTLWPNDTADAAERPHAQQLVNLVDSRLPRSVRKSIESEDSHLPFWPTSSRRPREIRIETLSQDPITAQPLNLLRISDGDACCRCADGTLKVQKAIELGHTFHLGTRYSEPLMANVMVPPDLIEDNRAGAQEKFSTDGTSASQQVPMQMGCHGIGISRMIGAVADTLADEKGLNWPRVMAPFEVVVIPSKGLDSAASEIYDTLSYAPTSPGNSQLDLVLDDRSESFPWKMQDADLVGYPIIVIVSRRWKKEQMCEIQCRRLGVREEVYIGDLAAFVKTLLAKI